MSAFRWPPRLRAGRDATGQLESADLAAVARIHFSDDLSKARALLGYQPRFGLRDGLLRQWAGA